MALNKNNFSRKHFILFIIIFAGIGYLLFSTFAVTNTKSWNTQGDFQSGALTNTTADASGNLTLSKTTTGGAYSFARNLVESGTQGMEGVAAGDINGDGKDDLVLAGDSYLAWYDQPNWTKHVIATPSGSGRAYAAGAETLVIDINGDGRNDVVTGNEQTVQELWFENTGSGWIQHVLYSGSKFHNIGFADFNGDGKKEAIAVDEWTSKVAMLTPPADVSQPWTYTTIENRNAMGLDIADINGDGKPDFATGRGWYRNNGGSPATFTRFAFTNLTTSGVTYPGGWPSSYFTDYSEVHFLDMNGDGKLDIFAVIFAESLEGHAYAFIQPSDPTQLWTATLVDNGPLYAVHSEIAADFDGSGKPQIMVGESNLGGFSLPAKSGTTNIYMYRLLGSATDPAGWEKTTIDTIGTHEAAEGDFNSDGKIDFTGHFENTSVAAAQFHWWQNNTTGATTNTYNTSGSAVLSLDAGTGSHFSGFNDYSAYATKPVGTNLAYKIRTSCNNTSWSNWITVDPTNPSAAVIPDGRYLQLEADLSTTNTANTPTIDKLSIDYAALSSACQSGSVPVGDITDFSFVTDSGCAGCSLQWVGSELKSTIAGGADSVDTAYGLKDFGGSVGVSGRIYARDILRLNSGQTLTSNLSIFQMRDVSDNLIYEIYIAPDRSIRLWSPAGGLASASINLSSSVVLPNDGTTTKRLEVSALANNSIIVRIDGTDVITQTGLSGATTSDPRYIRAGVDHYDSASASEQVQIYHSHVALSQATWLGAPNSSLVSKGDLNGDNTINIIDLSIMLSHYGSTGAQATASNGDCNSDGTINIIDLSIMLSNYGT